MAFLGNIFGKVGGAISTGVKDVGSVFNAPLSPQTAQAAAPQTPATPVAPKLTVDQFADKIKRKYPQYNSLDNKTLTQKIVAKYPTYASQIANTGDPNANTVEPTLGSVFGKTLGQGGQALAQVGKGMYSGFVEPFVKGVASSARAVQSTPSLFKAAVGGFNSQGQLNDVADFEKAKAIPTEPLLGTQTMQGSTSIQNVGTAAQIGSNLFGLGAEGTVAKTTTGAILDTAKVAAKQGALLNTGQYLSSSPKPTLLGASGAALSGAGTGAFMGGVAAAVSPVVTGQMSLNDFAKQLTPSGIKVGLSDYATGALKDTYDEAFNATKSGKKGIVKSEMAGKNPSEFLAKNGYVIDVKGSKFDTQPTIEKIYNDAQPLEKSLDDILAAKDRTLPDANKISLDDLASKTKARINTPLNKASGTLNTQNAAVDSLFADLKTQYGDSIGLSDLNKIKQAQWQQAKVFDATKPKWMSDLNYNTGKVAQATIENAVPEVSVKKLNGEIGDYMDAAKNLKKLDGNAVKGGRLGKYVNRAIGTIIGAHVGGLPGGITGDLAGGYITDLMQNNSIAGPIKRAALEAIPKDSAVYDQAQQALTKIKYGQPLLNEPAPGTPKSSNNVPIELPSKSQSTIDAEQMANMPVRKLKVNVTGGDDMPSQIKVFRQQMGLGKMDAITPTGGSVFNTTLQNNPPPEFAGKTFDEIGNAIDQNNVYESNQELAKSSENPYESWTDTAKQGYAKFKQIFNAWKDNPEDYAQLSKTKAGTGLRQQMYNVAKEMDLDENQVFDMFQQRLLGESKGSSSLFGKK